MQAHRTRAVALLNSGRAHSNSFSEADFAVFAAVAAANPSVLGELGSETLRGYANGTHRVPTELATRCEAALDGTSVAKRGRRWARGMAAVISTEAAVDMNP